MIEDKDYTKWVIRKCKTGEDIISELTPEKAHLLHMALGVGGEAGELQDAIKKHVMYNKELDLKNVIEELGDLEFYMAGIRGLLGLTREQVLAANKVKLTKRYATKFSNKEAQVRADKRPVEAKSANLRTILVLGNAGHGKDEVGKILESLSPSYFSYASSSLFACEKAVLPFWPEEGKYKSVQACYEDRRRPSHRVIWHDLIKAYNTPDKARLAKELLKQHNVYIGMRCKEELAACLEQKIFDYVLWVDASLRGIPSESSSSMTINYDPSYMQYIDNNGTKKELKFELVRLLRNIANGKYLY